MRIMMMMVTFLRILQANEIIDNIKEFFIRDLKKNVWMDDETKQSAKDKVSWPIGREPHVIGRLTQRQLIEQWMEG